MLYNFSITAWRNLIKNRITSLINVGGLSVAVACNLVILLFIHFLNNMDDFHRRKDDILLVTSHFLVNGQDELWGISPAPLAQAIRSEVSSIETAVRVDYKTEEVRTGLATFSETCQYLDPDLITNVISLEIKLGSISSIQNKNQIIISEEIASKYFGQSDPIGKALEIRSGNNWNSFLIGAVTKKSPPNASFQFSIMVPYDNSLTSTEADWNDFVSATFVLLKPQADKQLLVDYLQRAVKTQNAQSELWKVQRFEIEPLSELSIDAYKIRGCIAGGFGNRSGQWILFMLGISTLLLACFNHVNITISQNTRRLKEIAIRKTIGSSLTQLVVQFFLENLVLVTIATAIGFVLAAIYFIPAFDALFAIGLSMMTSDLYLFVKYFILMVFLTTLLSGLYPAIYVCGFRSSQLLRNTGGESKFLSLKNVMTILQITTSIILISFSFLFIHNQQFLEKKDLGYNATNVFAVQLGNNEQVQLLKNHFETDPQIQSIGKARTHVGTGNTAQNIKLDGKEYQVNTFTVGEGYFNTMQLRLNEGLLFNEKESAQHDVIVNKTFIKNFQLENPLKQSVIIDSASYNIIGVVEDFHFNSLNAPMVPLVILFSAQESNFLVIRSTQPVAETKAKVKYAFIKLFPSEPVSFIVQTDLYNKYISFIQGHTKVIIFCATVSIVITAIGIFGLISLSVTYRLKELSIRKVLGASNTGLFFFINRNLSLLFLISSGLGIMASYFAGQLLFDSFYVYHSSMTYEPFIKGFFVTAFVVIAPTCLLLRRLIRLNPANLLKQ